MKRIKRIPRLPVKNSHILTSALNAHKKLNTRICKELEENSKFNVLSERAIDIKEKLFRLHSLQSIAPEMLQDAQNKIKEINRLISEIEKVQEMLIEIDDLIEDINTEMDE